MVADLPRINVNVSMSQLLQVYDGDMSGLKLHPGSGFTGEETPELTLSADSGRLMVRYADD